MPLLLQAQTSAPAWSPMLLMVGMFAVLYFFMIRPQQRRAKEHQAMLKTLAKGDHVMTSGGLFGTVVGVKEDRVVVRLDENCKVEVSIGNVSAKLDK
ncbi:MAG: preprotein translocase subunit YajC [Candidatus Krumholzibacteriia bacterium]|nr:preprotein translocase subunit YajC [bacterium]MCB9513772.1 preprotein translocase subunit YajC [Candidatus Latescibacterota bacterium]MCB9515350.1 preprotein translocase subunit YajC [Candidatus Latescibacterota bacterium]